MGVNDPLVRAPFLRALKAEQRKEVVVKVRMKMAPTEQKARNEIPTKSVRSLSWGSASLKSALNLAIAIGRRADACLSVEGKEIAVRVSV